MGSRKFDGVDSALDLEQHQAKRVNLLGKRFTKSRRYRVWSTEDILFILGVLEDVHGKRGAQKAILGQLGLTTAHVRYWRVKFIHRRKPAGAV